ncbi:MAG: DNA cytosine methyltransferase, partial [Candidatus Omnitrophica bacterium]|nr:DNA cytosine methyltransferase [Candidatus Omnitrophota bacterium]
SMSGNGFGCEIANLNGIARTLVAGNMGRERNLIKDRPNKKNRWGIRRLTIREYARIQGFPDSFKFPVPVTQAYKQLGNAVTVPVAKALAKQIIKVLSQ